MLVKLELRPSSETLVEREGRAILLEQGVNSGQTTVPRVLQILQGQSSTLLVGFQALLRVLRPHALRVDELRLPRDDIPEDVWNQRLLVVAHTGSEVRDTTVGLLGPSLVG